MVERIFLTEEETAAEIREVMRILGITHMPSTSDFRLLNKEYLHNKVCRTKKYRGWAEYLGVPLKVCETHFGNDTEILIAEKLTKYGYTAELMTTKHPYDILINGTVKVDVKGARKNKGKYNFDAWTFNLAKENPTCDIYILIAFDVDGSINRELVIPSHFLRQKVVTIGAKSSYDVYNERYDYIQTYTNFYEGVTQI